MSNCAYFFVNRHENIWLRVRLTAPQGGIGNGVKRSSAPSEEKVAIDPSKGGQIDAPKDQSRLNKVIEVEQGVWPWEGVLKLLELDLFNPSWPTRHGAACAIRDILKPQGAAGGMRSSRSASENQKLHATWCNNLAGKILCVLILDRFCDFSNDQVGFLLCSIKYV